MQFKTIAAVLAFAGLAAAQNSTNATYTQGEAKVNMNGIEGTFLFQKVEGGINVTINIVSGLTTGFQKLETGFDYHVHDFPVGANNNCTATGAHLDPAKVGVAKPCDPLNLTSCQTGDLAGKHGNFMALNNETGNLEPINYLDTQLTFDGPLNAALLGRSIVIHNNGTRVACADIVVPGYVVPAANGTNGTTGGNGTAPGTDGKPDSSATKLIGSGVAALSGVVAFMMLAL
ncbi:hypothetical protein BGZ76_002750 [Entomortierella beljakovae]|nr:hypothetical protein BGZ76_002750 [Entomortierella beljakovae]